MFKSIVLSPRKRCEFAMGWPKNHISGYTSGTGNHRQDPFTLDLWPHFSFETSPRLSKSVHPSLRNRSRLCVDGYVSFSVISPEPEVSATIRLNLINDSIRAFKWVQVCSNRLSHRWEKWEHKLCLEKVHIHTYMHTYIHTHTQTFFSSSWVEWYITLRVSGAPFKSRFWKQFYIHSIEKGKNYNHISHQFFFFSIFGKPRVIRTKSWATEPL